MSKVAGQKSKVIRRGELFGLTCDSVIRDIRGSARAEKMSLDMLHMLSEQLL